MHSKEENAINQTEFADMFVHHRREDMKEWISSPSIPQQWSKIMITAYFSRNSMIYPIAPEEVAKYGMGVWDADLSKCTIGDFALAIQHCRDFQASPLLNSNKSHLFGNMGVEITGYVMRHASVLFNTEKVETLDNDAKTAVKNIFPCWRNLKK